MTGSSPLTALVTDSSSQLTPELAARWNVGVVPVTVDLDGQTFIEGVDLDADGFFERFRPGESEVSTAQPSPARFMEAFAAAESNGAQQILCVLVGAAYSGTIDSARLAAKQVAVPVRVVDTGMASFGVSCCLLAAAERLAAGSDMEAAAVAAEAAADVVESVFLLQGLELANASGRYATSDLPEDGVPILRSGRDLLEVVASVNNLEAAVEVMADSVVAGGRPVRVASGLADQATAPLTSALVRRLEEHPLVVDIVHYRVGPSVAAHTGPGTAGVFYYPAD